MLCRVDTEKKKKRKKSLSWGVYLPLNGNINRVGFTGRNILNVNQRSFCCHAHVLVISANDN